MERRVATHGVVPRHPIETFGSGLPASRGRTCIIIAALAHIIAWVLITALGMPVEPEVNNSCRRCRARSLKSNLRRLW